MSTLLAPRRGLLALALVASLVLLPSAASSASPKGAELRVVSPGGETVAQLTQYTSSARIATDPKADCFGTGTGGSGEKVEVKGPTALGQLHYAERADRDLDPLSITDAFDFGLGICGIGGLVAPPTGYWYLKHNHASAQLGADQLRLRGGDEVLWYLIEDFNVPPPIELSVDAPARIEPGELVITVHQYADDGTRSPASGVTVTARGTALAAGAATTAITDAAGRATLSTLGTGKLKLGATRGSDIPAAERKVCVAEELGDCPEAQGIRAFGTPRNDRIETTKGPDLVKPRDGRNRVTALAGDDEVVAKGGGPDRIDCGAGFDTAIAKRGDRVTNCEEVRRK